MDNPTSQSPASLVALQQSVQRKLGLALLRLQQCELLMKKLASEHELSSSADESLDLNAKNRELIFKKSLGQVVGDLKGTYLRVATASSESDEDDEPPPGVTLPFVRTRVCIRFSEENFRLTEQNLGDLVNLRNELVHHFIEKFDLFSADGCEAAHAYLDQCLKRIGTSHAELKRWTDQTAAAKRRMVNLMNTPEFTAFVVDGILPGGAGVAWESCTVVSELRDAEIILSEDGWTSLAKAINYLRKTAPEQTPRKYGCSSWRHLLHESGQFEVRKYRSEAGDTTEVWYRSRS